MDERKALAKLLRTLADYIEEWSADDVEGLVAGRKHLGISMQVTSNTKGRPKGKLGQTKDWSDIVERLRSLRTRDDGQKLIDDFALTRAELEHLARFMDLPVAKQDNAERLREKIIAASIGARLISQAIRGKES